MQIWSKILVASLFVAAAVNASTASASDDTAALASKNVALLASAKATVQDMQSDPNFGPSKNLLQRAQAVLIVPHLVKGGFVFGGEGGSGVLLRRQNQGWSSPAFYTLASASFGLQVGLESAQLVMFVMSDRALHAIEQDKFKLGAGAGLTVVTIGANAQAATSGNLTGDIIVWSATKGAYGGLTLEGSVIAPDEDANSTFYGRPASVADILDSSVSNRQADALRHAL